MLPSLKELFGAQTFEIGPQDQFWPHDLYAEALGARRIYGIGDPEVLLRESLSIVGARKATPYGLALAKTAGRVAAESGLVTVSGGALGVDIASARATLQAGGIHVIVSGTGADIVYPSQHRETFIRVIETGGVVCALERWETPPQRFAFPKRNKLIAGLSRSLLVTEAGLPSGTLSTAQAALDMGRNLYAAPGSIYSPFSRGTNWLIGEGATILVDEESLEVAISRDYGCTRKARIKHTKDGGRLFSALLAQPMRPNDLAAYLGKETLKLLKLLSDYEIQGLVVRLPDGRYAPSKRYLLNESSG